jgi:4'-phosphopantetheinyl transferase
MPEGAMNAEAFAEAGTSWTGGPAEPWLAAGSIHVWWADLDELGEELAVRLCESERQRANRIAGQRERRRWSLGRGLLRTLLARYVRCDPLTLRLTVSSDGKPVLDTCERPSRDVWGRVVAQPFFNLSHSGPMALYAFSAAGPVGVDVEVRRRPIDVVGIARRVFGQAEALRLEALDPAEREEEFLRAWVRHEAQLKCLGTGFGGVGPGTGSGDHRLWVSELDVGPGGAAAVASAEAPSELHCFGWPARPSAPAS